MKRSLTVAAGAVRAALERVLSDETFSRSPRMIRFLRFIVEAELDGKRDLLKESVIGINVFDREPTYDPKADPIVRVEARRLRSKLQSYYERAGREDETIIDLPTGGYVPVFSISSHRPQRESGFRPAMPWLALALATGLGAYGLLQTGIAGGSPIHQVAVLPLQDLSETSRLQSFCDGLTEEIIANLSRRSSIRVTGRASAVRFRADSADLEEVGRELKADAILRGAVRKAGNRIRVTVQLIRVRDQSYVLSRSFDRDDGDSIAIQTEIAAAIGNAVDPDHGRQHRPRTENSEALQLYVEGRTLLERMEFVRALQFFERAIELDPSFALAHAGAADCHARLVDWHAIPAADMFAKAEGAASRALEIDPLLAEVHTTLAVIRVFQWNWNAAEAEFRKALRANPSYGPAHGEYAVGYLAPMGLLDEAARESRAGVNLDPLSPAALMRHARVLWAVGRFDEARGLFARALELDSQHPEPRRAMALIDADRGRWQSGGELLDKNPGYLAAAYARSGRIDAARRLWASIRPDGVAPLERVVAISAVGDLDAAFRVLEDAYRARAPYLSLLAWDPQLSPLRADNRTLSLLRRMNLRSAGNHKP